MTLVVLAFIIWVLAWFLNVKLADSSFSDSRFIKFLVPTIFGTTIIVVWELLVRGWQVPLVILPPPSLVIITASENLDILWKDLNQTFFKGALRGYIIGCGSAIIVGVLVERYEALRLGMLPVANFMAALPIVGTAPILVMWFGFDWESKAAVVVVMVFFPMLINTVAGLQESTKIQNDLLQTYAASKPQTFIKLRFPAAMPFIFNGLKICTTLALIGAIVAEFFGSPTLGMGFRISTSVGQLALDMVWAEIVVAALAGSIFYGLMAIIEKGVTFWHPSQRG
jgi:NitT/TauT family transport system permease protein|tara:strand:- start:472 stop:1317 length:846 start_codon:yes stop_codon:yes gene_type:complete